jgi:glycosyltransferase involved in cell wall biosynthesis
MNADTAYILNLALAFNRSIGQDFVITLSGGPAQRFTDENVNYTDIGTTESLIFLKLPRYFYKALFRLSYAIFLIYFPFLSLSRRLNSNEQVIFSSDPNLLAIIIFWKKTLVLKYRICSDWHMLSNNWKDGFIAKRSDFLVATSHKLKRFIIERTHVSENKILVAYGGIDPDLFKDSSKDMARIGLNLPEDKKLFGYMGLFTTLRMEKGIGTMVRALKYLDEDVMLVLVGRRDREGVDYGALAEELGVKDRCIIVDFMEFEKMIEYEQAMDILVIPYPDQPHFRNYGFPMKVYEYMAARRSIIYSKLDLTEEGLDDCAFMFTPDDPEDLADKIKYVLANPEEAELKAMAAYQKISGLTWDNKAKKIIDFLTIKIA